MEFSNPDTDMLPLFPPQTVGLTELKFPAVGFGGDGLTVTVTDDAGEVHPDTV